jgi:hypothetical protein
MKNKAISQQAPSKTKVNTILREIPYTELLTTLDSFSNLQTAMQQLTAVLGNEPIEVITQSQSTLTKFSNELIQSFVVRYMRNNREAVRNWENEGGRIEYASV